MQLERTMDVVRGRAGRLAALLLLSGVGAFALATGAQAQESDTVVRIEVDAAQPIPAGTEFVATVLVENVSNLAGFDFTLAYDPERVRPVEQDASGEAQADGTISIEVLDIGVFITANGQRQDMICDDPRADLEESSILVSCVTIGPPVCLGGDTGASGSGVLGGIRLESRGGTETTLALTKTTLVLDDVAPPCDAEEFHPVPIEHRNEDLVITLSGSADSSNTMLIIGVIVAVVVVGGVGIGGIVWYSRNRNRP